ncbi:MAG: hypothetical protein SNJ71_01915 [Bacteroidales bacterium]
MMKYVIVLLSICLAVLYSCQTETKEKVEEVKAVTEDETFDANTKYKLPSPVELYLLIREANAQFNAQALNPTKNVSNYLTNSQKAINFGIYASDLAYCTVFERQQETTTYFKTLKDLATQLGITEGYNNSIVERLDRNLHNSVSLYQITHDSYWEVCNALEEGDKSGILSQILLGGWVESVYLAVHSVKKFDANDEIVIRITEQSFLLENLIAYLSTINKSKEVDGHIAKLKDLQNSFDKLLDNPENIVITKEQFVEIADKIKALRAELIK